MDVFPYRYKELVIGLGETRTSYQGGSLPFWLQLTRALNGAIGSYFCRARHLTYLT